MAVVGVSYKPGVGDVRESPALKIIGLLRDLGAQVLYHDPHVPELGELALASTPLEQAAQRRADEQAYLERLKRLSGPTSSVRTGR